MGEFGRGEFGRGELGSDRAVFRQCSASSVTRNEHFCFRTESRFKVAACKLDVRDERKYAKKLTMRSRDLESRRNSSCTHTSLGISTFSYCHAPASPAVSRIQSGVEDLGLEKSSRVDSWGTILRYSTRHHWAARDVLPIGQADFPLRVWMQGM